MNRAKLVSAVHPNLYGNRFMEFMNREVIVNEEKKRNTLYREDALTRHE